ncbi:glycine betaine/proline transport system substrate-binding protein [Roseovarius marisflavi]|uniref:Glycine betaine/proline transport system substrate-binding protein n=1 Tax=Roseovarius marisflavi TaxID=1054996 RepID=A0A1M6YVC1_9RHOB|nr:ABC transporter substrate-binding protein [Roseovarius marisflavi]SHL22251.1 glycine betaine/proline transport system substrate-binding protein [Roseovarius marisflavi]
MKSTCLAIALTGLALPAFAVELGATDKAIKLAINDWTGQQITTHIAGDMLEAAGYKVEYVPVEYDAMFREMIKDNVDGALEIWRATAVIRFTDYLRSKDIVEIGDLGISPKEGLAYPAHMEAKCPGLPNWEALRSCADAFATNGAAELLDYPEDWEGPGADLMTAFDLPFTATPAASEEALVDALVNASKNETPILATFWSPHWAVAAYDLRFVEMPAGEAECHENPAWGANPNEVGDCDFVSTEVVKAVVKDFKRTWPAAYKILEAYQISNEQQQALMVEVERDGRPVADVAADWIAANEESWRSIVDTATQ